MFANDETGGILEHRVKVLHIHIATLATFSIVCVRFWKFKGGEIALLLCDELVDALYFWGIHESTLYTNRLATIEVKHITTTNQLLSTGLVKETANAMRDGMLALITPVMMFVDGR